MVDRPDQDLIIGGYRQPYFVSAVHFVLPKQYVISTVSIYSYSHSPSWRESDIQFLACFSFYHVRNTIAAGRSFENSRILAFAKLNSNDFLGRHVLDRNKYYPKGQHDKQFLHLNLPFSQLECQCLSTRNFHREGKRDRYLALSADTNNVICAIRHV